MSTINHTFKSIPDSIRNHANCADRVKNSLNNVTDRKLLYTDAFKLFSHLQKLTSSSADRKLTDNEIVNFALHSSDLNETEFNRIFKPEKSENSDQTAIIKTKVLQFYKDIVVMKNNRTVAKQYLQYTLFGQIDKFDGHRSRFNDPMDFFYGSESPFESELFRDLLVASGAHRHNYFDSIIGKGLNFAWTNTASNIIFNMIYGISVDTAKENSDFQKDLTDAILEGVRRDDAEKTPFGNLDEFLNAFKKDGYERYDLVSDQREQQIVRYAEKFAPYLRDTNSKSIPKPKRIVSNQDQLAVVSTTTRQAVDQNRNKEFTYESFAKKIGISFDDPKIDSDVDAKMKAALGSLNSIANLDSLENQLTGIYDLVLSVDGLKEILQAVEAQQDQKPMEQAEIICEKLKLDKGLSPLIANVILFYSTVQNTHLVAQLSDLNDRDQKDDIKKLKENIKEWISEVQDFQIAAKTLSESLSYSNAFNLKKSKLVSLLFSKKVSEMQKEAKRIEIQLKAEMKSISGSMSVFSELLTLKSLQGSSEILERTLLKFDKYIAEISQYLNPEMTGELKKICESFPRYLELQKNVEFIKQVQENSKETDDFKTIFTHLASRLLENQEPVHGMIVPNLYQDQFGEHFDLLPLIVKAHQGKKLEIQPDVLNALNRYCVNSGEFPDPFVHRLMLNILAQDKEAVNRDDVYLIIRFIHEYKKSDEVNEAATELHKKISAGKEQNLNELHILSTEFESAEKTISAEYKTSEAKSILSQDNLQEITKIEDKFDQLKSELSSLNIWEPSNAEDEVPGALKNRVLRIYLNSLVDTSVSFEKECESISTENVDTRVTEIRKKFNDLKAEKIALETRCAVQIEKAELKKSILDYKKRLDSITQGLKNCDLEITQSHAQFQELGISASEADAGKGGKSEDFSGLDEANEAIKGMLTDLNNLDIEYLKSYSEDLKLYSLDAFETQLASKKLEALLLKVKIEAKLEDRRAALVQIASGLKLPDQITVSEVNQALSGISEIINSANGNHQSIKSILALDHVFKSEDKKTIEEYYYNTILFDLLKKCGFSKDRCFVRINERKIEGLNQTDSRHNILLGKIRQYNKWIAVVESYTTVQSKIKTALDQFTEFQETELLKDEIDEIKIKIDQFKELNTGLEQFFNTTQESLKSDAQLVEGTTKTLLGKALASMFGRTSFPNFLAVPQKSVPEIEPVEENPFENSTDLFGALFSVAASSVPEVSDTGIVQDRVLPKADGTGHEYTDLVKQKLPERLDTTDESTQRLFEILKRKENGQTPTSDEETYIKQQIQDFHKEKNLAQKLMSIQDSALLEKKPVREFLNYFVVKLPVILSLMSQDDSQKHRINAAWHDIAFRSGLFDADYSLDQKIKMYLSSFSNEMAVEFQTTPSSKKTPVDHYLDLMISFNICKDLESSQKLGSIAFEVQKTFLTKLTEELNLSQGLQKGSFDALIKYLASDNGIEKSYADSLRTSDGSVSVKFPEDYFSEGFQKYLVRGEKFKLLAYLMRAESEPISVRPSFVVIQERAGCDSGTKGIEDFLVNGIDKFIRHFSANRVLDQLDLFSLFTDSFYGQEGQYLSLLELRHLIPFEKLNNIIDGEELAHEIQKVVVSIFAFAAMKWNINLSEFLVKIRSKASAMTDDSHAFHLNTWYSLINSCAAIAQMLQKTHGNYRDAFLGDNLESTFVASSVDQAPAIMDKVSSGQIQVGSLILEKLSKLFSLEVALVDVPQEIVDVIAGFRGVGNWSVKVSVKQEPAIPKASVRIDPREHSKVIKRTRISRMDLHRPWSESAACKNGDSSLAWRISQRVSEFLREQIAKKIESVDHVKSAVLALLFDRQSLLPEGQKTIEGLKKHYKSNPAFKPEEALLLDQFCTAFSIEDDFEIFGLVGFLSEPSTIDAEKAAEKSDQILKAYQNYIKTNGVFLTPYEKDILDKIYNVETNVILDAEQKHFRPSQMGAMEEVKSDGNGLLTSFLLELRRLEDGGAQITGFTIVK